MSFGDQLELLLPSYLTDTSKERLVAALSQFKTSGRTAISYDTFYQSVSPPYFLQGDIVREIRFPLWNENREDFTKGYIDAMILSNTCDISSENRRSHNKKECILAPVIRLQDYITDLINQGYPSTNATSIQESIKGQRISNLFFLPSNDGNVQNEFIALLDKVVWFPTDELNQYAENMKANRARSMSLFGSYLLALKLSFHFCRLPEDEEREF
jgi:hypothetical protein